LQLLSSTASKSSEQLKTFITETERMRICCWSLLGELRRVEREGETQAFRIDVAVFGEVVGGFYRGTKTFEESWAPVKSEIPPGIEYYVRSARHESLHVVEVAHTHMEHVLMLLQNGKSKNEVYDAVRRSEDSLHRLLNVLDNLISLIKSVNETNNERLLTP